MKRILLFFVLLFTSTLFPSDGFKNLQVLQEFARNLEEYPPIDNDDRLKPDYTSFHKQREKGRLASATNKVLGFFRLKKKPFWTVRDFKSLLNKLVKQREHDSLTGGFIQKITLRPGDKVIVWGDLQGAFHSLVRDLAKLKELGIIDDKFRIKERCFFVFNGDLIDRSPHQLETLSLAMQLMHVNPNQVFYLEGNHESKGYWHDYALRRELEIRARHLSKEKIPLNKKVNRFFKTLPAALYLKSEDGEESSFVRISHYGANKSGLEENQFEDFLLSEDDDAPQLFKLVNSKKTRKSVDMKAFIRGISRSTTYRPTDGLTLLSPEKGVTTWTLLSAPTSTYRALYSFFNDAFCILDIHPSIDDWTITLYTQDVRDMDGFKDKTFNMLSGQRLLEPKKADLVAADPKIAKTLRRKIKTLTKKIEQLEDRLELGGMREEKPEVEEKPSEPRKVAGEDLEKTLVLGSSLDLSKTAASIGRSLKQGLVLRVNKQNKAGGLRGQRVKLVVLDDEYTPHLTVKNVETFLKKYKTPYIMSPLGSPTNKALISKIEKKEILDIFPWTGSSVVRNPELKNIIHFRTSYANEALALINYALEDLQLNKFVFFYQKDAYGEAPLFAARRILKDRGIKGSLEVSYLRNEIKVDRAGKKIKDFNPEAIFFFSVYPPSVELIRKIGVENLAGKSLLGISGITDSFRVFLKPKGVDFIISRIAPNPETSNLEIVKDYREDMKKDNPTSRFTVDSLEGYINVSILFDIIEKMTKPLTPDGIIEAVESMKNYNLKGLKLNFDPNTRELSKMVWVDLGEGEWLAKEIKPEDERISLGLEEKKKVAEPTVIEEEKKEDIKEEVAAIPKKAEEKAKEPVIAKEEEPVIEEEEQKEIRIGSTLWSSEPGGGLSPSFMKGMSLRANKINREGGINGKQLKIVFLDDKYDPAIAKKNIKTFLEKYKINILLSPNGSATLLSYFNLVKEGKILVLFPVTGAGDFRVPSDHVVHFRASYPTEGRVLTEFALDVRKLTKMAIFYQDDAYGKAGLFSAREALKKHGIDDWLELPYARKTASFAKEVKQIEKYNPQGILFFSTDKAAAALLRQLGTRRLTGKLLLGFSDLAITWFKKFIKQKGIGFIIAQVVPNAESSKIEVVQEAKAEAEKVGAVLDTFVLEGYINTDLAIDIFKKIKGNITKEKIIKVINDIKDYEYKGFKLNLNPKTRELSNVMWLETEDGEWIEQKIN